MGVRGSFHFVSVNDFNCMVEGRDPDPEDKSEILISGLWAWLHDIFKHQKPPLDKTISGDYVPKEIEENTIDLFYSKDCWDYYCGLVSPQLVIEIAKELSQITEATWNNWCLEQGIDFNLYDDFEEIRYAYTEAAKQGKALMSLIV